MLKKILLRLASLPPFMLSALCGLAIIYLTLFPKPLPDNDLQLIPGADKIVHAIMFGGFALCLNLDFSRKKDFLIPNNSKLLYFGILSVAFGGIIELLQKFMDLGRGGDFPDFLADIAGVLLFTIIAPSIIRFLGRKSIG